MYNIIVNPAARSGLGQKIWEDEIRPELEKRQTEYNVSFSEKKGDVCRITKNLIANNLHEGTIDIIVLGGDGTANEVFQGICESGFPTNVHVGYIPTGSGNDLARDLRLPISPLEVLNLIINKHNPTKMDLGRLLFEDGSKRYFSVSCGIGYDAAVCEEVAKSSLKKALNKIGLGKLIYLLIGLKQVIGTRSTSSVITIDNNPPIELKKTMFIAVMNHRFEGGGFMFCPKAIDNDGRLDLCVVGDISKINVLMAFPSAYKGEHFKYKGITPYKAKKVTIETSAPLWVHNDGEVEKKSKHISIECMENAVYIYR